MAVKLQWLGEGMRFAGGPEDGPLSIVDGDGKVGPSPMTTFLMGLVACTASDIVDIATKMRVAIGSLDVHAIDERRAEPPRHYTKLRLVYTVKGVAESDRPKIERAVELSHEKYCSALHPIRKDVPVETEVAFA
jgi:putative redox protein